MIKNILILFSFLSVYSALNVTLEKDFFFVSTNNSFHNILYQTQTHIIAQSIEETPTGDQFIPQYLALDLQTGNATQILADISSACDPAPYVFGKLIYHDASDKLIYYCANNNTILFIDQESFEVFDTITIGGTTIYNETRLASDDDFLVILGITDFFGQEPTVTQFIRVNLITREVPSNFSFNGIVSADQTVVVYASNKFESYVLATQSQNTSETAYLYLLVWDKNIFKLVLLTNFNYNNNGSSVVHNLHCFGSYIVTNTATDMLVINQLGKGVQDYANLASKRIYTSQSEFAVELSYGMQYESSDLYVLFNNGSLEHITVSSSIISSEIIGTAAEMMLVIGDADQSNLLFTISDQAPLFNVINTTTSEIIYTRPNYYTNLMLTNSTYSAESSPYLFIFDTTNDTLLANVTIPSDYFHDTDNGFIYFLDNSSNFCKLFGLDLTFAQSSEIYEFGSSEVCAGSIITQVDGSTPTSPQVAISLSNTSFFILTNDNGLLIFDPTAPTPGGNFVYYSLVDFSTLNLQSISCEAGKKFTIELYTFNSTSNSFISGLNYSFLTDAPLDIYDFYTVGTAQVVGVTDEAFGYLDIQTTKPGLYNLGFARAQLSLFHDTDNNTYMIFSEDPEYAQTTSSNQAPYLFSNYTLGQLPETSSATTQAGAAGFCSYWIIDGMISSVGVAKFYNGCSESVTESISI